VFQGEDGYRHGHVTGVQTCALPIWRACRSDGQRRPPPGVPADLAPTLARLRREVPSPGPAVLDEGATAERTARGIPLPALRPAKIGRASGRETAQIAQRAELPYGSN